MEEVIKSGIDLINDGGSGFELGKYSAETLTGQGEGMVIDVIDVFLSGQIKVLPVEDISDDDTLPEYRIGDTFVVEQPGSNNNAEFKITLEMIFPEAIFFNEKFYPQYPGSAGYETSNTIQVGTTNVPFTPFGTEISKIGKGNGLTIKVLRVTEHGGISPKKVTVFRRNVDGTFVLDSDGNKIQETKTGFKVENPGTGYKIGDIVEANRKPLTTPKDSDVEDINDIIAKAQFIVSYQLIKGGEGYSVGKNVQVRNKRTDEIDNSLKVSIFEVDDKGSNEGKINSYTVLNGGIGYKTGDIVSINSGASVNNIAEFKVINNKQSLFDLSEIIYTSYDKSYFYQTADSYLISYGVLLLMFSYFVKLQSDNVTSYVAKLGSLLVSIIMIIFSSIAQHQSSNGKLKNTQRELGMLSAVSGGVMLLVLIFTLYGSKYAIKDVNPVLFNMMFILSVVSIIIGGKMYTNKD